MLGSLHRVHRSQPRYASTHPAAAAKRPAIRQIVTRPKICGSRLSETTVALCEKAQAQLSPSAGILAQRAARRAIRADIEQALTTLRPAIEWRPSRKTAQDRWLLSELSLALWALDERFLKHYSPANGKTLSETVSPAHLIDLYSVLNEAYDHGTAGQRALLLSILPRQLPVAAGIAPDDADRRAAERLQKERGWQLNMDESLALVDYLHPRSMSFHALNIGLRLKAYWGMGGVADACDAFAIAFRSALDRLAGDPAFINREGVYYKGIEARGGYLPNQWLLACVGSHHGSLLPPHPVSATRLPMQSFAAIHGRPQDSEVLLRVPEAIDMSVFHGRSGKSLGEVIILPRPLTVTGSATVERRGRKFRQWQLEEAQPSMQLRVRKR